MFDLKEFIQFLIDEIEIFQHLVQFMRQEIFMFSIGQIGLIVPFLVAVAFLTLIERKTLSFVQRRQGPNVRGIFGLLQPFADALKLLFKEIIEPIKANYSLFILAPIITFSLHLLGQIIMPLATTNGILDVDLALLYVFGISSIAVYGIVIAGQASNSKYGFLGALRSSAQLIAYEISLGFIILTVVLPINSFNLLDFAHFSEKIQLVIPYFLSFLMFFISMLAELNRPPFDLPEAEAELVSGYNVEYSGPGFALFFIGEYMSIIFLSAICVLLFLGGYSIPQLKAYALNRALMCELGLNFDMSTYTMICQLIFIFKMSIVIGCVLQCRTILPRYRYDQLMQLGQKVLLPISICQFFFCVIQLYLFNDLPKLN